jgi:hypothetical protein
VEGRQTGNVGQAAEVQFVIEVIGQPSGHPFEPDGVVLARATHAVISRS